MRHAATYYSNPTPLPPPYIFWKSITKVSVKGIYFHTYQI